MPHKQREPDAIDLWFGLKQMAIAALVSLVALVFLVRANKAPADYQTGG